MWTVRNIAAVIWIESGDTAFCIRKLASDNLSPVGVHFTLFSRTSWTCLNPPLFVVIGDFMISRKRLNKNRMNHTHSIYGFNQWAPIYTRASLKASIWQKMEGLITFVTTLLRWAYSNSNWTLLQSRRDTLNIQQCQTINTLWRSMAHRLRVTGFVYANIYDHWDNIENAKYLETVSKRLSRNFFRVSARSIWSL